jgi:signal transduction histidine kinase
MTKSPETESSATFTCSVTGLPILRRPEWTDVLLDNGYGTTFSVLGGNILVSQAFGFATLRGVKKALNISRDIVTAVIGGDGPYVHVLDSSNLQGASLGARKYYIDDMKKRKDILGLIFCGASPMFKMSIKLAKRFNLVKYQVEIVRDYSEAVGLAVKILSTTQKSPADSASNFTPQPYIASRDVGHDFDMRRYDHKDPSSGLIVNPDWFFQSDDFSLKFEVIEEDILHGITTGFLKEEHIAPSLSMQEQVIKSMGLSKGDYYYVLSLLESKGTSHKVRKQYIAAIMQLYSKHPFQAFVFYGANRFLRAAISLASSFVPFKVGVVKDLDSALRLITEFKTKGTKPSSLEATGSEPGEPLEFTRLQLYIDELLHFLGSIDWEADGFDERRELDPSHPLRPVFDAIALIKMDLDELYQERKKAEDEQRILQARLQRAQRMEAVGTLAGGVAHDLNNVLTGIVSYPDLLLLEIPEESPLRESILAIKKSGQKAVAIVQDLLTLARRGVAVTEVLNLNNIISEYLKSPEFEKLRFHYPKVKVESNFEKDLLNVLGSPVHISKTVMNLVSNAAEAMPDGGTMIISTKNRYIDRPVRGYDCVEEGDYVTLTISDTGIGISSEDMERIFEPFYAKKVMGRSGAGLAMAVVWETVKDHSGYIDAQSVQGKGTTFTLYFPVTRKQLPGDKSPLASGSQSLRLGG